ncbi:MAG TPA: peptide-methionine (S)-S-oxide reductase MsrA [Balneolales bacterium]|nr:peptide-methionine (S)-S-oxide reductase MsrA [Balneolales bacterium]
MQDNQNKTTNEIAILGAGCFWCTEAIFQRLKGVITVKPGYAGGHVEHPGYEEVCSGRTGHAEVAQIEFNPSVISFEDLLKVFWHVHDPTTPNRQGADIGTQYRSVVFYTNNEQKNIAEKLKSEYDRTDLWKNPIVTEIAPYSNFYEAEDYHQDYFNNHRSQPYCSFIIGPKIKKLYKDFSYLLEDA